MGQRESEIHPNAGDGFIQMKSRSALGLTRKSQPRLVVDGRTGIKFERPVTIGFYMHYLKTSPLG